MGMYPIRDQAVTVAGTVAVSSVAGTVAITETARDKREFGQTEPEVLSIDNAAGDVFGPLAVGIWVLKAEHAMYWTRGTNTLAGTDVKVDEATPDTDEPLLGGESVEIEIKTGETDNYVAARTASGTGLFWLSFQGAA